MGGLIKYSIVRLPKLGGGGLHVLPHTWTLVCMLIAISVDKV